MKGWCQRVVVGMAALAFLGSGAGNACADTLPIDANSNFFTPGDVTVATGDTVTWTFHGNHTVTSGNNGVADGLFDSGIQSSGTFSFPFNQAGDYPYFCRLHFVCCNMHGIVHVVDPVKLRTHFTASDPDDPNAVGKVAFQMRPDRAGVRIKVKHVVSTLAVDVFVNGNFLGSIFLDANGDGHLALLTNHSDTVPQLQVGDVIEVLDMVDDTTLILSGTLAAH